MNNAFYILLGDQLTGPYYLVQILQMVQNGQLMPMTIVKSCDDGQMYRVQDLINSQTPQMPQGTLPIQPGIPGMYNAPAPIPYLPLSQPYVAPQQHQYPFTQNIPQSVPNGNLSPQPHNANQQVPFANNIGMPSIAPNMPYQSMELSEQTPFPPVVAPIPQSQQSSVNNSEQTSPPVVAPLHSPQLSDNNSEVVETPVVAPISHSPQFTENKSEQPLSSDSDSQVVEQEINKPDTEGRKKKSKSSSVVHLPTDGIAEDIVLPPKVSMRSWIDRSNPENGTIVCPHCWGRCSMETILFISMHPELTGDDLLGDDVQQRFLPKYYTSKGTALDARGMECTDMACPHCHLKIPNSVIDLPSTFFSIVGAPASGKSYQLTSMIWQLRKALPQFFHFTIYDTDPSFNMVLNQYEKILFLNPDENEYVSLPKTELRGKDFSNLINIDNNNIDLPKPFVFTMTPQETHSDYYTQRGKLDRSIVLYDNAGEHFEVGRDSGTNLATVHLIHSDGIIFLFDPLKDVRLKEMCSEQDPQVSKQAGYENQNMLFTEMVARIRKFANLRASEKYAKPLIVVVPKYDAWKESFPLDMEKASFVVYDEESNPYLDMGVIGNISFCLRRYLLKNTPEIVGMAEGFAEKVYFIPTSALGRMPEFDDEKGMIGIKPNHIKPIGAELPFLLQMHLNGLLAGAFVDDESIPVLAGCQFKNQHVSFAFPESKEVFTLPSYYCGATIFNEEDNKYYKIPEVPSACEADVPQATPQSEPPEGYVGQNLVNDHDFWNK